METKTHLIISDIHIPYHDAPAVGEVISRARQATTVTVAGDLMDFPGISRWSKGTVGEYTSRLEDQINQGKKFLANLRRAFDGPIWFHMGNHEERVAEYIRRYAPGFSDLGCLTLPELLQFKEHGVELVGEYHKIDDQFATTHGHLGRLARTSGGTALGQARKANIPIVCGHGHRLGVVYETRGVESLGTRQTIWGMETGHLMNIETVKYQRDLVLNWQAGYGTVTTTQDGLPTPLPVQL